MRRKPGARAVPWRAMRVQLWSYNYDPEPQGIAPMSTMLARGLAARGHDVTVVAAHPHYPEPAWGVRLRPYRERRDGVPVLRLPLWAGRDSGVARIRQELSFLAAQTAVAPLLPRPDALVAVTPSFPALAAAMGFARARRVPLVIWLQDILPDGAVTTGLLKPGRLLDALFAFERAAYDTADRVVVISEAFRRNLLDKGVPDAKLERIFNPSSRQPETADRRRRAGRGPAEGAGHGEHRPHPGPRPDRRRLPGRSPARRRRRPPRDRGPRRRRRRGARARNRPARRDARRPLRRRARARAAVGLARAREPARRRARVQPAVEAHDLHGLRHPRARVGAAGTETANIVRESSVRGG